MRTVRELCAELRIEENKKIKARGRYTGGSDKMKNRLQIFNVDKLFINENSIFQTLKVLGRTIPFEEMAATPLSQYYNLATNNPDPAPKYKEAGGGWFVIADYPVVRVAMVLNELFDRLESRFIAKVADR